MRLGEHPIFRKLNRIIFRVVIPIVATALVIYIFLAPKTIHLDEDYYLIGNQIKVSGGETVAGPGELRFWGRYPWVYGTVYGKGFRIDLKEKTVEHFKTPEAFERFLREEALDPALYVTPDELRGDGDRIRTLKDVLFHKR